MDSGLSDCSKYEEGSISCSFSSMDSFAAEKSGATSNTCDIQLSKQIASLEAENKRLRIDVENARIEANTRHASNQSLKSKIAELFVEAHNSFQERQKLQNALNDANQRLTNTENSFKRYARKLYDLQIHKGARGWSTEDEILKGHSEFSENNRQLACRSKKEEINVNSENLSGKLHRQLSTICGNPSAKCHFLKELSPVACQPKLKETNANLEKPQTNLPTFDKCSRTGETLEDSMELVAPDQYSWLLFRMMKSMEQSEAEKRVILDKLRETEIELIKLHHDNEHLRCCILSSKCEQIQVDDVIVHLHLQLDKLTSQHKLLKSRNLELEHKLIAVQDVFNENERLKSLLCTANASLFENLQVEKHRAMALTNRLGREQSANRMCNEALERDEKMNSMRDCLRRALERNEVMYQEAHRKLQDWEQLEERLKAKISDESIDEGYGDSSFAIPGSADLPSSPHFDTILIKSAEDVLSRSENFMAPLEQSLEQLRLNIGTFRRRVATKTE